MNEEQRSRWPHIGFPRRGWLLFGCDSAYGGTPPEAVAASLVAYITQVMRAPRSLFRSKISSAKYVNNFWAAYLETGACPVPNPPSA
ncbi:MAG: hypothetical protein HY746_05440 [Elusimicrobia bacterium]|nr:hypothetical protein [Elusimicrobiota bacterium]